MNLPRLSLTRQNCAQNRLASRSVFCVRAQRGNVYLPTQVPSFKRVGGNVTCYPSPSERPVNDEGGPSFFESGSCHPEQKKEEAETSCRNSSFWQLPLWLQRRYRAVWPIMTWTGPLSVRVPGPSGPLLWAAILRLAWALVPWPVRSVTTSDFAADATDNLIETPDGHQSEKVGGHCFMPSASNLDGWRNRLQRLRQPLGSEVELGGGLEAGGVCMGVITQDAFSVNRCQTNSKPVGRVSKQAGMDCFKTLGIGGSEDVVLAAAIGQSGAPVFPDCLGQTDRNALRGHRVGGPATAATKEIPLKLRGDIADIRVGDCSEPKPRLERLSAEIAVIARSVGQARQPENGGAQIRVDVKDEIGLDITVDRQFGVGRDAKCQIRRLTGFQRRNPRPQVNQLPRHLSIGCGKGRARHRQCGEGPYPQYSRCVSHVISPVHKKHPDETVRTGSPFYAAAHTNFHVGVRSTTRRVRTALPRRDAPDRNRQIIEKTDTGQWISCIRAQKTETRGH